MSVPQIPTSRKAEYLVYLGFSGAITLFVLTNLPPNLRTTIDSQIILFMTIVPAALAGVLFAVRMDKIVDWIIERYICKEKRMKEIVKFIGRVNVFLRFWELVPTRIASLEEQANQSIKSVIDGEDLHEEVWTQKGIFFLILSICVIGMAILVSETAANDITLFFGSVVFTVGIPITLIGVWHWRYKTFPDRCILVLEFRYYQDNLLTERLMRSVRTPKSKEDSGTPSWMREGYKDILWDLDERSEYKDALVKQCDEIDKILLRKEWIRFESQFSPIRKMLDRHSSKFIEEDALDFVILAWSELLALEEITDSGELKAKFDTLRLAIKPISNRVSKLADFSLNVDVTTADLHGLLEIVDPEQLNPTLFKKVGKAISQSLDDDVNNTVISPIVKWLKGNSKQVLPALKILEFMNPLSFEKLLQTTIISSDSSCVNSILDTTKDVSYRDVAAAFPILAKLSKDKEAMDKTIEYLTGAVTSDDHSVRIWAIDALAEMGDDAFEYTIVHDAFLTILQKPQDDVVLAIAFAFLRLSKKLANYPSLIDLIRKMLPFRNHYIQQKLYEAVIESGVWNKGLDSLLFSIGQDRCPPKETDLSKMDCKLLFRKISDSDSAVAMRMLVRIQDEFSDCLSESKNIQHLLNTARNTEYDCIRVCIASLLSMQADTIPVDYHLAIVKEILELTNEINNRMVRNTFALTIGRCKAIQFELAKRIGEDKYQVISALSMYYMGNSLKPYPEIIRSLTKEIPPNSEIISARLLAISALGSAARNYPSLLDIVILIFESSNIVEAACALECLRTIGGLRVHQALKATKRKLNHWWLRDLYRNTLRETA